MPWLYSRSLAGQQNTLGPPTVFGLDQPRIQQPDDSGTDQGAALAQTYQTVSDYLAKQRAQSAEMGLWDDQAGRPTAKGLLDAAQQTAQGVMMGTTAPGEVAPGFTAYHGSPHSFDAFDTSKIGTGEGVQAYGHGLYVAENEGVAQSYKMAGPAANSQIDAINRQMSQLAKQMDQYSSGQYGKFNDPKGYELKAQYDALMDQRTKLGHMYEVQVNADPAHFLDWDKPISEQSPQLQDLLDQHGIARRENQPYITGQDVHDFLSPKGDYAAGAQRLKDLGIPGIRYLDAGSRGAGTGTSNHVIFDANTLAILRKYGIAGLIAGGTAAGSQQPQQ